MSFWKGFDRQQEELARFSGEHQTALTIARQIKEGYQAEEKCSIGTKGKRAKVVEYFDTVWEKHQKAEEKRIFSLAEKRISSATKFLPGLRKQHGQLNILIEQLRQAKSVQLENFLLRVTCRSHRESQLYSDRLVAAKLRYWTVWRVSEHRTEV